MKQDFSDIIHLDRPKSKHPKMSIYDRSAQFSPFAALTGHYEAIIETARRTETKKILSKEKIYKLNMQLNYLIKHIKEKNPVIISYFKEDNRKTGGTYITQESVIKKIDIYDRYILLEDDTKIPFVNLYNISADCLEKNNDE